VAEALAPPAGAAPAAGVKPNEMPSGAGGSGGGS
jgi:hypothetical protein